MDIFLLKENNIFCINDIMVSYMCILNKEKNMKLTKNIIKNTLEKIGFTPRAYQIDSINRLFRVSTLGMSIPRQNGKTETAIMASVIAALRGDTVIYLLHNGDLVHAVAQRTADYMQPLKHIGIVSDIIISVNRNEINFGSGGKILFKIRSSRGIGVGLTADVLICDEAQKMTPEELESALPSTTTSPRRCLLLIGTPPTDDDLIQYPQSPLLTQRDAYIGTENWIEFGIGDYDSTHTPTLSDAHKANPAWREIPNFSGLIAQEQATLAPEAYARQRLGAWVLPGMVQHHDPEFSLPEIKKVLSPRGPGRSMGLRAGVGVYPDSINAYLCYSDGESYEILPPIPIPDGDLSGAIDFIARQSRVWAVMKIPANSRGKALYNSQGLSLYKKKISLSSMPETATSLGMLCRSIHDSSVKIFSNDSATSALGSMWRGYDSRSSSGTVEAGDADMRAAALSIVLATGTNLSQSRKRAVSWVG